MCLEITNPNVSFVAKLHRENAVSVNSSRPSVTLNFDIYTRKWKCHLYARERIFPPIKFEVCEVSV